MTHEYTFVVPNNSTITLHIVDSEGGVGSLIPGSFGIDVSSNQGIIDWLSVAAHIPKVMFAIIRSSFGRTRDIQFDRNWRDSKANGILRSAYHYFSATTPPLEQVEALFSALKTDIPDFPLTVDVEPRSGEIIPNRIKTTEDLRLVLTEIERRTGIRPIIYTAKWAWPLVTTVPSWSSDYMLWVSNPGSLVSPTMPAGWSEWKIWQYSYTGRILGINSNVDLNRVHL